MNGQRASAITLILPTDTQHLRLARLVAAGVAAPAGLGIDDIDDLRMAVDELCTTLVEAGPDDGTMTLTFVQAPGEIEVRGVAPARIPLALDERRLALSKAILAVVADEHDLAPDGDSLAFRLVKRADDRTDAPGSERPAGD